MTRRWRETLPNGASYETLDCIDNGFYDNTSVYTVPSGSFFILGGDRDNSTDSRALSAVGSPDNLIGRVDLIFFSRAPRFGWRTGEGPVGADRHRGAMRAGRATRCSCFSDLNVKQPAVIATCWLLAMTRSAFPR